MTYDELFQLKGLEKAKLLAGRSVLSREILGAHVVEIIEAQDWVKKGELIFLSGVAFHQGEEEKDLKTSIQALAQREVSGVVIEIGPYIASVPDTVLDLANELDLPLLTIPYEVSVSEIISQIYFDIYNKEEKNKSIENFMTELLYGNTERALERIELFQYNQNQKHLALYIGADMPDEGKISRDKMNALVSAVRMSFVRQRQLLYLQEDDGIVAVLELDGSGREHDIVEKKRKEIEDSLHFHVKDMNISMGVGNLFCRLQELAESVSEARKAYRLVRASKGQQTVCYYNQIGIYRIFFNLKEEDVLENLLQETLGPLMEYDRRNNAELVHTLEIYLQKNESITDTTAALFVHRNTVKYRIKRIEEILGMDLKDVTVRFNLRLAYKIWRYLG